MSKILINIHSFVDLITNSSTEIFIVNPNNLKEQVQDFFNFIKGAIGDGGESYVETLEQYDCDNSIILPEGINRDDCFVINASYHDELLNEIIEKYFKPIDYDWKF